MQVAVWYPAKPNSKNISLKYKDYIGFTSSELNFINNQPVDKNKALDIWLRHFPQNMQKQIIDLVTTDLNIWSNAEMQPGNFPLVIYAPPQDSHFFDNNVLCEYLASKGYIVISTTAKGEYTRLQGSSARSIHVQAEDIAYLLEFGKKFTKNDKVGTMGFSRGGLANLIFALKNKNIDATISLDGSIFSQGWIDDMKQSLYFNPEEFTSPLLMITKNLADPKKNPATFFDQVKFADKALIRFDHDKHGYFSSLDLLTSLVTDKLLSNKEKESYLNFYTEMVEYSGQFFDSYLKDEGSLKEHEQKKFNHNYTFINAQHQSLDPSTINFWIAQKGIDYTSNLITKVEKIEPGYTSKLRWRDLNPIADEKVNEKAYNEAIKILLLSDRATPGWYLTNYKLGECYRITKDFPNAIMRYKVALNDNPRHQESIQALKNMNIHYDYHNNKIASIDISKYIGKYVIDEKNYKEIIQKNNTLYFISSVASDSIKIWPYSDKLFISEEENPKYNIQMHFQLDHSGNVISLQTRGMNSGKFSDIILKQK